MDWLAEHLERFDASVGSMSPWQVLALFVVCLLLTPATVLVHELGHALMARRHGARLTGMFASGEGPALELRRDGFRGRFGLGLGRDLASREPPGWVLIDHRGLTVAQMRAITFAGSLAQLLFGVGILLLGGASGLGWLRYLAIFQGLYTIAWALKALNPRIPGSDGAQLRLLSRLNPADPVPAGYEIDPNTGTSFPPPGA